MRFIKITSLMIFGIMRIFSYITIGAMLKIRCIVKFVISKFAIKRVNYSIFSKCQDDDRRVNECRK
jgi:hypothetical protein